MHDLCVHKIKNISIYSMILEHHVCIINWVKAFVYTKAMNGGWSRRHVNKTYWGSSLTYLHCDIIICSAACMSAINVLCEHCPKLAIHWNTLAVGCKIGNVFGGSIYTLF